MEDQDRLWQYLPKLGNAVGKNALAYLPEHQQGRKKA
jgi:hypothetical protein